MGNFESPKSWINEVRVVAGSLPKVQVLLSLSGLGEMDIFNSEVGMWRGIINTKLALVNN